MCGTCGCKSAESGKKNCGCGQDPCKTFGAESYSDEVKAKVFDKIFEWHEQMQLQGEGIEYELDRMRWMLENPDKGYDDYPYTYDGQLREGFDAETTCASCGEGIDEFDIIGDGTNRGLCCVPDYYDDEPEMVHCSFCSKIIGTEEEVYDEESVEWYNANGETICPPCHREREKELKNDLDPHYSPFYAENFEAQNYEDWIIHTSKYDGHTKGPWTLRLTDESDENGDLDLIGADDIGITTMTTSEMNNDLKYPSPDVQLIRDAPKILEAYQIQNDVLSTLDERIRSGDSHADLMRTLEQELGLTETWDEMGAETEKPFWENITMSSKKKKDFSPLYHGLIAGALGVVALRIRDMVKK